VILLERAVSIQAFSAAAWRHRFPNIHDVGSDVRNTLQSHQDAILAARAVAMPNGASGQWSLRAAGNGLIGEAYQRGAVVTAHAPAALGSWLGCRAGRRLSSDEVVTKAPKPCGLSRWGEVAGD
jgi:hypothetical protein